MAVGAMVFVSLHTLILLAAEYRLFRAPACRACPFAAQQAKPCGYEPLS
jgi:hypothetical protein